jgi:hypothetical protein
MWGINDMIIEEGKLERFEKNVPSVTVSTVHPTCNVAGDRSLGFAGRSQLLTAQ